ncbi:MAG: hypothetical protein EOO47_26450, partial [Flavobacterium sp.]
MKKAGIAKSSGTSAKPKVADKALAKAPTVASETTIDKIPVTKNVAAKPTAKTPQSKANINKTRTRRRTNAYACLDQ